MTHWLVLLVEASADREALAASASSSFAAVMMPPPPLFCNAQITTSDDIMTIYNKQRYY